MLCSSKWSKILPILFCYGEKGTGKSTIAKIAAKLHATELCSASDTFASLRNKLNERWLGDDFSSEIDGVLLAWDNIYASTFEADAEKRVYGMFLYGYDKSSDAISIANRDGTNSRFRTFCPKIISSVEALHTNPSFTELQRRLLIVYHKKADKFTSAEKEGKQIEDVDLLDFDYYSWTDFDEIFSNLWNDLHFLKQYVANRKRLLKANHKQIKREQWIVSIDIMCVMLTCEFFDKPSQAVDFMYEFFKLQSSHTSGSRTATHEKLLEFIESETKFLMEQNAQIIASGREPRPVCIPPRKLKDYVTALQLDGALDTKSDTKTIVNVMSEIGFKLTKTGWMRL
jgi:hypothetical protein